MDIAHNCVHFSQRNQVKPIEFKHDWPRSIFLEWWAALPAKD
jgi:hypothetical protein